MLVTPFAAFTTFSVITSLLMYTGLLSASLGAVTLKVELFKSAVPPTFIVAPAALTITPSGVEV